MTVSYNSTMIESIWQMNNTIAAAQSIATARRNRTPLQPFSDDAAPQSEAEGYRFQDALHGLLAPYDSTDGPSAAER